MKFLICGLGSIGKRHLGNLESLGFSCKDISIFRTRKGAANFGDCVLENHGNRHPVFYELEEALAQKPDVVFITNPTSLHIPVALEAAEAGCHLFIEKPLSHSMEGVDELIEIVGRERTTAFIGYNRRFHPLLLQIKTWLEEKRVGQVFTVHAEMASRATDWHPWEDFKISYAARKELGGGVITAQVHELDYLYWFFGKPKWIFAAGGEFGNLGIGVEDTCKSIMEFGGGIIASLHVDYLKHPPSGFLEITGTEGRIYWNYFNKKADLIPINGEIISATDPALRPGDSWMATTFPAELEYFLKCVGYGKQPSPGLKEGKDTLEMILATKESVASKKIIYL